MNIQLFDPKRNSTHHFRICISIAIMKYFIPQNLIYCPREILAHVNEIWNATRCYECPQSRWVLQLNDCFGQVFVSYVFSWPAKENIKTKSKQENNFSLKRSSLKNANVFDSFCFGLIYVMMIRSLCLTFDISTPSFILRTMWWMGRRALNNGP